MTEDLLKAFPPGNAEQVSPYLRTRDTALPPRECSLDQVDVLNPPGFFNIMNTRQSGATHELLEIYRKSTIE